MYILIRIGAENNKSAEVVSKKKSLLVRYLKEKGYYWSSPASLYIDDKTCGIKGGSGVDYLIEKIDELV